MGMGVWNGQGTKDRWSLLQTVGMAAGNWGSLSEAHQLELIQPVQLDRAQFAGGSRAGDQGGVVAPVGGGCLEEGGQALWGSAEPRGPLRAS